MSKAPPLDTTSRYIEANDLRFHVLMAGTGDPVLFLHGFPDHAATWKGLMGQLAHHFHVIAPDQRGYNLTSRPEELESYRTDLLVADMIALLDAMNLKQVTICGHDWGGIIAFHLAMRHPDRVNRLIILNSVHPYIFQDRIWDDPKQRQASQYFGQMLAGKPPAIFSEENCETLIENWFAGPLADGQITVEDIEIYRAAWTRPGVWQAMINWYRASGYNVPRPGEASPETRWTSGLDYKVEQPVLLLWGEEDRVFVRDLATDLAAHTKDLSIKWLEGVGHAPQRTVPDRCAREIITFLSTTPPNVTNNLAHKNGINSA